LLKESTFKSIKFIISLRKKYDTTINVYPSNRKEYNIISFLIGAKTKAAINYLRMDKQNLGWLNNCRITEDDSLHNVQTNIKLIEKITGKSLTDEPDLQFYLSENDLSSASNFLKENKIIDADLVIGFHPGTSVLKNHIKRRWEPEKFAELGKQLISEYNCKIIIFGGPDELELKEKIRSEINSPNVYTTHGLNLAESAAVMKRCNVFVSNDSSLMHVASALKLNLVCIIGPTSTNYIHPWNTKYKIASLQLDCSPCFIYSPKPLTCKRDDVKFKCIKELEVNLVFNFVKDFISND
ncbi:MAG: glycosyltransferase family 9 protein, partial [Bacteroidetes bacterium]|nr:glycosyltransferase family 9 protein [Bacteroidota bacterium]